MMYREPCKALAFAVLCASIPVVGVIISAKFSPNIEEMGIYGHPSGNASYVAGEACTINAELDRPEQELREEFEWCLEQHRVWVAKEVP